MRSIARPDRSCSRNAANSAVAATGDAKVTRAIACLRVGHPHGRAGLERRQSRRTSIARVVLPALARARRRARGCARSHSPASAPAFMATPSNLPPRSRRNRARRPARGRRWSRSGDVLLLSARDLAVYSALLHSAARTAVAPDASAGFVNPSCCRHARPGLRFELMQGRVRMDPSPIIPASRSRHRRVRRHARGGQASAQVLLMIEPHVRAGVTTGELDGIARESSSAARLQVRDDRLPAGGSRPPFPGAICTSVNHVVCHGIRATRCCATATSSTSMSRSSRRLSR